ncbi:hypothetical protein [Streptomyces sp. ATCC 21386]|uniref:hypothetical protein n=1 Tax=Streptomyces sp. ATCC 21386 TaxID=2699428 RepID=UPI001BFF17F8|nr:hypothetical protein [Streptomyces sp. ATCC 21386]
MIIAAVITAAASITVGVMTTTGSGKSESEAGRSSVQATAPVESPTPAADPTPTPSVISTPPTTPPSTPPPVPTPAPTQPVAQAERPAPELAGTWVGTATESNSDSTDSYRVRLELTDGAVGGDIGEVHYEMRDSRCQGDLTLLEVDPVSEALSLGEYIQTGNCVKGGRITLTPLSDGTLDFAYTGAKVDGSEQSVNAVLAKVR